ncbi:MAG: hypothetical protein WCF95_02555 [bacterium]
MGRKIIKDAIHVEDNGDVTVNLKGVNKKVVINPKKIRRAPSEGDDDAKVIELAVKQHRLDLILSLKANKSNVWGKGRLENYAGSGTVLDPLYDGRGKELVFLLSGKNEEISLQEQIGKCNDDSELVRTGNKFMLEKLQKYPQRYAAFVSFTSDKALDPIMKSKEREFLAQDLVAGHAYSIKSVDDKYVYLLNPWDPSKPLKLDKEMFLQIDPLRMDIDITNLE